MTEEVEKLIEEVEATIAKSKKIRESVDENDNFFAKDAGKRAAQRARGKQPTGFFG